MNSIALAATTHRKIEGVSDGTSTQVEAQIINKCKAIMASRRLCMEGSPYEKRDWKKLKGRTSKYLPHPLGLRIFGC